MFSFISNCDLIKCVVQLLATHNVSRCNYPSHSILLYHNTDAVGVVKIPERVVVQLLFVSWTCLCRVGRNLKLIARVCRCRPPCWNISLIASCCILLNLSFSFLCWTSGGRALTVVNSVDTYRFVLCLYE